MLKPAQLYIEKTQQEFWKIAYDDYYKYYSARYMSTRRIAENNQYQHEFVSVDCKGDIIGFIAYSINTETRNITSLETINFSKNFIFANDLMQVIDDIFCKYKFRKLTFNVICGNSIEKNYDKLINEYGGRIVGIMTDEEIIDGEYCDIKIYEIMREKYLIFRPKKYIR